MDSKDMLENLERMGLCKIIKSSALANDRLYKEIENHSVIKEYIEESTKKSSLKLNISKGGVEISTFGRMFVRACIA